MNKLSGGQLAGGNSATTRVEHDFYATDPETLKMFLYEFWKENTFGGSILEPACGQGHMSKTLKELLPNFDIISTDLINRGYGIGGVDFLTHDYKRKFNTVITNPPFSLAKEFGQFLPYSQVRRYISNSYPPVARLDVNGVKVEYDIYKQELYDKAASIALELITLVNEYKNSKAPIKGGLLKRLFDEFGAAILTQVEVSYQLVMLADFDYENIITAEKKHKKELQRLKKLRHLTDEDRLALFKAKITELQLEQRKSQILSERAEALRGLYFNAGLSPVKVNLTKIPIKDVAADIRKTLNQDLVDMLSGVKVQLKKEKLVDGKSGWAKSSGWLENVVSNATKPVKVTKIEKIIDANKTEKKQEIVVKTQIMQLGAYKELKNANEDWEDLISKFPELKNYNKKLQEVNIDGNKWLRLQVSGNEHEIKNSCDKIKKQGYGCLLR